MSDLALQTLGESCQGGGGGPALAHRVSPHLQELADTSSPLLPTARARLPPFLSPEAFWLGTPPTGAPSTLQGEKGTSFCLARNLPHQSGAMVLCCPLLVFPGRAQGEHMVWARAGIQGGGYRAAEAAPHGDVLRPSAKILAKPAPSSKRCGPCLPGVV